MERKKRTRPYSGHKPYIFVSYAHEDSSRTMPIIERLSAEGFRIWYDEGLSVGEEWPAEIQEKLTNSASVIAMMSNKAVGSRNCRNEINFSLNHDKPMFCVYFEPTELLLGMELQLSSTQSLHKYKCYDEEDFFERLFEVKQLNNGVKDEVPVAEKATCVISEPVFEGPVRTIIASQEQLKTVTEIDESGDNTESPLIEEIQSEESEPKAFAAFAACKGIKVTVWKQESSEEQVAGQRHLLWCISASDYKYRISNGQVTIEKYIGEETEVIIPERIEGYPVTSIDADAFLGTQVDTVTLPDSITSVGKNTFHKTSKSKKD